MVSKVDDAAVAAEPERASEWSAFSASLPLLVVTVGLFVGSVVVYRLARTVGPDGFPLWGLLMTLGFIAAIGTTVSWFFAKGAAEVAALQAESDPAGTATGRPVPDVRHATAATVAEDWDESTIPVRSPAQQPPVRPVSVASVGPDDVERALDEIAQIEEELEGRGRSSLGRPPAPARS
jgi:hypothetical protein